MAESPRIGVFVCDCGSNIAGVVNVPAVVEDAATLDHVVLADQGRWSCSVDYLSRLQELVKEHDLDRVVIASCTPRTHEHLFKTTVEQAGLNPYLLEFVSIREQVSWVHMNDPDVATRKAKDLVRMGVAKAALLEEGQEIKLSVGQDCLVIGGGVAGMSAALSIADQGFHAVLVERQPSLGGLLTELSTVSHGLHSTPAEEIAQSLAKRVDAHPGIDVHVATEVAAVEGYVGHYKVTLRPTSDPEADGNQIDISTVIVATGMREHRPEGWLLGEDPRVVTQLELEAKLRQGGPAGASNVVMVNCVGSRNEERGCCNIGCFVSVKNALALKAANPERNVTILYRDLSLLVDEQVLQQEARRAGVRFIRFPDDRYPEIVKGEDSLELRVHDLLLGSELRLPADLLVLTPPFTGDASVEQTKGLLKVSANSEGFFQEAHIKLGPLDFSSDGVHLCGAARGPKMMRESIEEGMGAAMRASIPMKRGYIKADGIVAKVDQEACKPCGICSRNCPFNAITLDENKIPTVVEALCKGCGLCVADCAPACISLVHYTDEQILAQVEAALAEAPESKIVGFVCHWCALGGVDMAGVSRLQYPAHGRLIRVMCSARVSINMVMHAFELGAAGVMVAGCEFPTCHYITGNYACEKRMKRVRNRLAKKGFDPEKLWNIWCSAADGPKFAKAMWDMSRALGLEPPEEKSVGS
jgi:heterodisulfide reductase subunit A